MADDKQNPKASESQHINLKVLGLDDEVVLFTMNKHEPIRTLMQSYCNQKGLSLHLTRFLFDGQLISHNDAPITLEMEEGDTIETYQSVGGKKQKRALKGDYRI